MARRSGRHCSAAVLVFAGFQIALVAALDAVGQGPWLTLLALGWLCLGMVPFARRTLARWQDRSRALSSMSLLRQYRRDMALLWGAALLGPPVWLLTLMSVTGASG